MSKQIDLIRQALSAAESSIGVAKQLLSDLEKEGGSRGEKEKRILPGVVGVFDGENVVTDSGEKHLVPANYASKSMLVVGDKLKLTTDQGEQRFKQIEHVKRYRTKGVVTKKDGKFHVVTPEGSYRVLSAAVAHFGATTGDEAMVLVPAKNLTSAWAAIESVPGKEAEVSKEKKEEKGKDQSNLPLPVGGFGAGVEESKKEAAKKESKVEAAEKEKKPSFRAAGKGEPKVVEKPEEQLNEKVEEKKEKESTKPAVSSEAGEDELR